MDHDAGLMEPFEYIAALPSKGFRDLFVDALNEWLDAPAFVVDAVKSIVRRLHTASLLLDDIEDASVLRRGQPTAHERFGVARTLNAANAAAFHTLQDVLALARSADEYASGECAASIAAAASEAKGSEPKGATLAVLMGAYSEELDALHRGQGLDILWRDTQHCPTLEEYRGMAVDKTGGMFRIAVRLLAAAGEAATGREADDAQLRALLAATDEVGYLFQVLDDLCNLSSTEYHCAKSYCEDIAEGKFSFLTTHAVLTARRDDPPLAERLLELLAQRPSDVARKNAVLDILHATDTFAVCREELHRCAARVSERLALEWARAGRSGHSQLQGFVATLHRRVPETVAPPSVAPAS